MTDLKTEQKKSLTWNKNNEEEDKKVIMSGKSGNIAKQNCILFN